MQVAEIQELIRQVGLAPTKAKNICNMSKVSCHDVCFACQMQQLSVKLMYSPELRTLRLDRQGNHGFGELVSCMWDFLPGAQLFIQIVSTIELDICSPMYTCDDSSCSLSTLVLNTMTALVTVSLFVSFWFDLR